MKLAPQLLRPTCVGPVHWPQLLRSTGRAFSWLRRPLHFVHSAAIMPSVSVKPVPLFEDNYAYLVRNDVHRTALIVDPADPLPSLAAADASDCELVGVLTTHHHWDHAGGNAAVADARTGIEVIGGTHEEGRIAAVTRSVGDGEQFELGGMRVTALHTPCHTRGHTCYLVGGDPDVPGMLFTGDTLFGGGCGRFFEGDAAAMHASLSRLSSLPPATRVFCGHEYTLSNLRFCLHVEPGNADTAARLQEAQAARAAGRPTVPSSLALERATNVFLRTSEPSVWGFTHPGHAAAAGAAGAAPPNPVEVLHRLREAKNAFK